MEPVIHPIFHVLSRRRKIWETANAHPMKPPYSSDGLPALKSKKVVDYRCKIQGGHHVREVLIEWKTFGSKKAT